MTDRELQSEIRAKLNSDPAVNPAQIGVAVFDGIVTLSGYTSCREEKVAVENSTASIDGVIAWVETIEVRSPESNPDLELAARARATIARHLGKNRERIKIKVEAGRITLRGRVEHEYEKIAAEIFVGKITGVKGIANQIEAIPLPTETEDGMQMSLMAAG